MLCLSSLWQPPVQPVTMTTSLFPCRRTVPYCHPSPLSAHPIPCLHQDCPLGQPWDLFPVFMGHYCWANGTTASPGYRSKQLLLQYIPRNMHTVFALLCFVVVIHWLIFSYPSGLLHWHCGNLVPAKQPWWIWINTSCEFIMNDCITTTKQSTTKPCAYFLGYTVDKSGINTLKPK